MSIKEQSETLTVERFNKKQDRVVRDFGYGDTVGALKIAQDNLKVLSEAVSEKINKARYLKESNPEKQLCGVIRNLDPNVVALSALSSALHSVAMGDDLRQTALTLGYAVAGECWAHGLLTSNKTLAERINRAAKKKHGNLKYRKQAVRSIAARAGYREKQWSRKQVVQAGGWLLDRLLVALPDVFELALGDDGEKVLTVSAKALMVAEKAVEQAIQHDPVFIPSKDAPAPWTGWNRGGYWDERSRLRAAVVRTIYKETAATVRGAIRDGSMGPYLAALNTLQAVPWTINKPVLEAIRVAKADGLTVSGLPPVDDLPPPSKDKPWEAMDDTAKEVWRHKADEIEKYNRFLRGERVLFAGDMATAERMAEWSQFYTPMNTDWRGRVYALCHFNFQRDDRVRSLFKFAEGAPIGEEGLHWLKVHVANTGDFDKISKRPFAERLDWVSDNLGMILDTDSTVWREADKPFLFLAACQELRGALREGDGFITHLPVSFDGSCSGLQHLTAMTRAPEGALVNLTPNGEPQDVYQVVADVVVTSIETDAARGLELAKYCLAYGVTRKVVKRNVMTYNYSSKKYGMGKQQDEDLIAPLALDVMTGKLSKHPFGVFAEKPHKKATSPAAKYLAEKIYNAITSVVDLPQQAMVFLQKIARVMAHEGKPVTWTTPSGLPWANRYHRPNTKRVELWLHDTRVQLTVAEGAQKEIDKDRAANGIAPNFVHALDASHLALTVLAAKAEGITSIATVHDSFGCLAPYATRFNQIIREQFVKMYEEHDVLNEILEEARRNLTLHNQQRLPDRLQYGNLNLSGVLSAPYAFA